MLQLHKPWNSLTDEHCREVYVVIWPCYRQVLKNHVTHLNTRWSSYKTHFKTQQDRVWRTVAQNNSYVLPKTLGGGEYTVTVSSYKTNVSDVKKKHRERPRIKAVGLFVGYKSAEI